jgi:hypothetical protein
MWKVLLSVYIIVIVVAVVLLLSALVLAKRSDQRDKRHMQPEADLAAGHLDQRGDNRVVELPTTSELNER